MVEPVCTIYPNGDKEWRLNGERHREDGPAIEYAIGPKKWFMNGKLHREDGPAIECVNGDTFWYLDDERLTEEDFNKRIQDKIHELW